MKRYIALLGCLFLFMSQTSIAQYGKNWAAYPMDSLEKVIVKSGKNWLPFIEKLSMDCGLYRLSAGSEDVQEPHRLDEAYYIVKGKATLDVQGKKQDVQKGSIVYVQANAKHKFENITEDLLVLVFFSKRHPKPSNTQYQYFDYEELLKEGHPKFNTTNSFLIAPTMNLGLSMMPQVKNGHEMVKHKVDEFSLVINGKGKFALGKNDTVNVVPGTFLYVKDKVPHQFFGLEEDLEVLIMFEKE
ncbi:cupin domain-containing protein [Reichenbachiella sp. MALMAid0571]|uniref:cupin domain-containing protein n=1 Tax=Reichenbachiella sp. MALMAid0571 TaxID=3143939 RepID=UPI0032DFFAB0